MKGEKNPVAILSISRCLNCVLNSMFTLDLHNIDIVHQTGLCLFVWWETLWKHVFLGGGAMGEGVNIRIVTVERAPIVTKVLFQWMRPFGSLW